MLTSQLHEHAALVALSAFMALIVCAFCAKYFPVKH